MVYKRKLSSADYTQIPNY